VSRGARIAVDIGGTFTDVALERADGALVTAKTLTTPAAPEDGFLEGIRIALRDAALTPADISVILHGTTLATNALIERRGAKTALLTTEGHRDSLEMAYENRFEQYDIMIDRPKPLVPRRLRLPVRERMNWRGEVLVPLDPRSVLSHVPALEREGVESVAIGFLHAYANLDHERRAADILSEAMPRLSISLAGEVAPEIREYERLSTAVANAYVRPLMDRYLGGLRRRLTEAGFRAPCLMMTSGGGLTTLDTAARFPIRLVESGPAGGAVLAASIATALDIDHLVSFDMGGTTAKLCLIDHGAPKSSRSFEVDRSYRFKKGSGFPVRIPVIEMVEIGAGGGSIAHIDTLGRLKVGPESAGSEPGPACYGRGGTRPTVTDADLTLGKIIPERFAGGAILLQAPAARSAIDAHIAARSDYSLDQAAYAISEVVDEMMASAARAHAVEQGADISGRVMVAFGGAAPLHAARLAEKLGIRTVVVPSGAGVGSAIGFLLAPASFEIVRSRPMRLSEFDGATAASLFAEMRAEAEDVLRPAVGGSPLTETRNAFMRYRGQGHEIAVALDGFDLSSPQAAPSLAARFEAAYRALYGRTIPGMEPEILTFALMLSGPMPTLPRTAETPAPREATPLMRRPVFDAHWAAEAEYAVYERNRVAPGDAISGPALIAEDQTTTVVTAAFHVRVDGACNLILTRKDAL
jgi:N-methylhydantoinase A